VQDADNLAWKLTAVLRGEAPEALLSSYHEERSYATDENILNSTRSTDFITPKSPVSRMFRDAVLTLAKHHAFARALVNSGRLSVPAVLADSSLVTEDPKWQDGLPAGAPCDDAPVVVDGKEGWLLEQLGNRFVLLVAGSSEPSSNQALLDRWRAALQTVSPHIEVLLLVPGPAAVPARSSSAAFIVDVEGLAKRRYAAQAGYALLIRPDQHIAARFTNADIEGVRAALARALCLAAESTQ
jgi:3-(3-hydroxy-phenyl)propionate hydroxylase